MTIILSFREEWCGRHTSIVSRWFVNARPKIIFSDYKLLFHRYFRSDSGKSKVRRDKRCKNCKCTSSVALCTQWLFNLQGIIMTDGPEWTDVRRWNKQICWVLKTNGWSRCHRFTLKHLKDFGFGRAGLEGVIQGEVNIIIKDKFTIKDFLTCNDQ